MTFSRANSGSWSTGEELTATQINTIDLNQSRAVDSYEGGDVEPSSPINFKDEAVTVEDGGIEWKAAAYPNVTSRQISLMCPLYPSYISDFSASSSAQSFGNDMLTSSYGLQQAYSNTTNVPYIIIPWLMLPYKRTSITLTSLGFFFIGGAGHAAVPTIMPKIELISYTHTHYATAEITLTDTTATTVLYQAMHLVSNDACSLTLSNDYYSFFFKCYGEAGTNHATGGTFTGIQTGITITDIMP